MSNHQHASFLFLNDRKPKAKAMMGFNCEHIRFNTAQIVGSFILIWITLMMVVKK